MKVRLQGKCYLYIAQGSCNIGAFFSPLWVSMFTLHRYGVTHVIRQHGLA